MAGDYKARTLERAEMLMRLPCGDLIVAGERRDHFGREYDGRDNWTGDLLVFDTLAQRFLSGFEAGYHRHLHGKFSLWLHCGKKRRRAHELAGADLLPTFYRKLQEVR